MLPAYSIIVPALIVYPSVHYLVPFGTVILWAGVMAATFTYFIASSTAYMSVFILVCLHSSVWRACVLTTLADCELCAQPEP